MADQRILLIRSDCVSGPLTTACVYVLAASCWLALPGSTVGLVLFLMWRFVSSVFNYVKGQSKRTFETRNLGVPLSSHINMTGKFSINDDTTSSSETPGWQADVSKISDRLLVGCNTPPCGDGPGVDALDFCNAR